MRILLRRLLPAVLTLALSGFGVLLFWFYEPAPPAGAPRVIASMDQTTWNRLGLNRFTYVRALRQAGISPVVVDFADIQSEEELAGLFDGVDGLMLSGGGDVGALNYNGDEQRTRDVNPLRDSFELALLTKAQAESIPVLGICRGAQLINVFLGGTLGDFRHDSERYDRHHRVFGGHAVRIEQGSLLSQIYEADYLDSVVTYHGQYVDGPGENVEVVAFALDGTPEAIEVSVDDKPFGMIGVQWHAEVLPWDDNQQRLFQAFSQAVQRSQSDRAAAEPSA